MRWTEHVTGIVAIGINTGFWWESQEERALGRPRRRWVDNIKMAIKEIEWS
jgi:hypothetical protein